MRIKLLPPEEGGIKKCAEAIRAYQESKDPKNDLGAPEDYRENLTKPVQKFNLKLYRKPKEAWNGGRVQAILDVPCGERGNSQAEVVEALHNLIRFPVKTV